MRTVAFCEIDPFCQKVLSKHWPDVPIHDDVTTREFQKGEADVICGGFPCQDLSDAGQRAGERSGLYRELVRAIRVVRPFYAIVENVAALLGRGLGTVLGDLAESGVDAEWDCVPACAVGAPHERDRIWIVAHPHGMRRLQPKRGEQAFGGRLGNGLEEGPSSSVANAQGKQMGYPGQPRQRGGMEGERSHSDAQGVGRGQGRAWRPSDSFAGIRDEARRNLADPYGARLAFREGLTRHAWEELPAAERDRLRNEWQSIWPDEPALSGVDDVIPDWMDRVKATGNTALPIIPEIIGRTIMKANVA